jgi:hypothetical protein
MVAWFDHSIGFVREADDALLALLITSVDVLDPIHFVIGLKVLNHHLP